MISQHKKLFQSKKEKTETPEKQIQSNMLQRNPNRSRKICLERKMCFDIEHLLIVAFELQLQRCHKMDCDTLNKEFVIVFCFLFESISVNIQDDIMHCNVQLVRYSHS